jgi:glycosyltransferase involved in cell wall biosynthesis
MKTQNLKINLLFDASILINSSKKSSSRSGIFFVAYNILNELALRRFFNISLFVRYDRFQYILKMKKDVFFSSFPIILWMEKDFFLSRISIHKKKIKETSNIFTVLLRLLQITKNYLKIFLGVLSNYRKRKLLDNIDIFFSPFESIPDIISNLKFIKQFIILHDTIPLREGAFDSEYWFTKILQKLDVKTYCFCVSECTKNDFLKEIPAQLDKQKMFVTYNATAQKLSPDYDKQKLTRILTKYRIEKNEGNYIFSLCSIDPRKNLLFTIACFIKFLQKHAIQNLYFYLGGGHFETFLAQFNERLNDFSDYRDKIVRLGYVDDEDINILYSNSLFFTYISQYEGFGMPPLEAMQAGTPVITSNNSSLPEVVGDAAIMIDYDNEEQCIKAFEDLYFNEGLRKQYIEKGLERAKLFSWEKTVDKMTEVILNSLEENKSV